MIRFLTFLTCLCLTGCASTPEENGIASLDLTTNELNESVNTIERLTLQRHVAAIANDSESNQGFVLGTNFAGCKWEVLQMSTNFIDWQSVQTNPFQSALSWTVTNTKPSEYFRIKGI